MKSPGTARSSILIFTGKPMTPQEDALAPTSPGPRRVQQGNAWASPPAPGALCGEAAPSKTPWTPGLTKNLPRHTRGPFLDGNQAHKGKGWILPSLKVLPLLEVSGKASCRISRHLVFQAKTCKICPKRSEPYPLLSSQEKKTSTGDISKQNSKIVFSFFFFLGKLGTQRPECFFPFVTTTACRFLNL